MSNNFVVLDIGESKIACLRGKKEGGSVIIDTLVTHLSEGIKHGHIINDKVFVEDLSSTIYEAEKVASQEMSEAFVNISMSSVKYHQVKIVKRFNGRQVTEKDLASILQKVRTRFETQGYRVIKMDFVSHHVEGMGETKEPEYMFVKGLTSVVGIVIIPETYLTKIERLVLKSHVKVKKFVLSSEASSCCCLTKNDRQKGAVVLDIGAGNTDYIIYEDGVMVGGGVLPLGGSDITRDIATYFKLSFESAEKIKIEHCGLVGDVKGQYIKTRNLVGQNKVIDKKLLREIISARLEEIIGLVLKKVGTKRYKFNFILTGGGGNISDLEMFLNKTYGILSRVVSPGDMDERFVLANKSKDILYDTSLSTACGMLRLAAKQDSTTENKGKHGAFKKLFIWIKESF